jgi:hypothetical protein
MLDSTIGRLDTAVAASALPPTSSHSQTNSQGFIGVTPDFRAV